MVIFSEICEFTSKAEYSQFEYSKINYVHRSGGNDPVHCRQTVKQKTSRLGKE
ncbi:hypothetical protein yfred0001_41870 [Yersinia frederiksenii ATCC 33641]|nr:hypothetical protein yfred0001_41870 [Yersinia frederiksenii ATCC 33641]